MVESQEGEAKGNIEIFEFFLADAMKKEYIEHYSNSLGKQMHLCIYGHAGVPLLGFPTQDSNCHNYEDFGIIYHLSDFIEQGRIQIVTVDSVDEESWSCENGILSWRSATKLLDTLIVFRGLAEKLVTGNVNDFQPAFLILCVQSFQRFVLGCKSTTRSRIDDQ